MQPGKLALLVTLCCSVLNTGSAVPQSITSVRAGAANLNLGLATDQPIWQLGTTAAFNVPESGGANPFDPLLHVFDATTGEVRNLGLTRVAHLFMNGRLVVFWASEVSRDLNGDGDMFDNVLHVYDTARRSLTNLRLASAFGDSTTDTILFDGQRLAFSVGEESQNQELNRDRDQVDSVVHLFDVVTGRLQNTGLAVFGVVDGTVVQDGRWTVLAVSEGVGSGSGQSRDLSGDGDVTDVVLHAFDTATRRVTNLRVALNFLPFQFGFRVGNGEGLVAVPEAEQGADLNGDQDLNDVVLHNVDLSSGRVRNTRIGIAVDGDSSLAVFTRLLVQEGLGLFSRLETEVGRDLNGDGDKNDAILHLLRTRTGQLRSLNLAASIFPTESSSGRVLLDVSEQDNGKDLNGDGVQVGTVLALADLSGNEPRVVNTGRRASRASNGDDVTTTFPSADPFALQIQDDRVTFIVSEAVESNRDLNAMATRTTSCCTSQICPP